MVVVQCFQVTARITPRTEKEYGGFVFG